jgi:hypothetical protein
MHLGIDKTTGFVYEGVDQPIHPVATNPYITRAVLIESEGDWKNLASTISDAQKAKIFREDTFDPVTRTRRGRLYTQSGSGQYVVTPHPSDRPAVPGYHLSGIVPKQLITYFGCSQLLSSPRRGLGMKLVLGTESAYSVWRIVQTEMLGDRSILITLKSLSAFGILPELDLEKIEPTHREAVKQAMDRTLNSAFRETPISVIDQCRNAISVTLARWIAQEMSDTSVLSKDLGDVAKAALRLSSPMIAVGRLAEVVAKLHSRGKGNEQHARDLRVPTEEDAQLALEAFGFLLRDIGWAKSGE